MVFLTQTRRYLKTENCGPFCLEYLLPPAQCLDRALQVHKHLSAQYCMLGLMLQGDTRERKQSHPPGLLLTKFSPLDS